MPRLYGEDLFLVDEFKERLGRTPRILNVGSGPGSVAGYLNVDLIPLEGVDLVADLNKIPWPFKDDSFDIILCNHIIEHMENIVQTMEEMHRVGLHGSRVVIRTPYWANYESFCDPTHRWHLTWGSFDFFVGRVRNWRGYTQKNFNLVSKRLTFAHPWRNPGYYIFKLNVRTYEKYFSHLFPGTWLHVQLEVGKDK